MIPKIIHYCWFGTKPIPEDYQLYIEGWQRLMPDYEIMLWNEENSPMHLPYLQAALQYKKWANLSNFVRIYALYHYGGIYMDTDMEVLKSLEPFRQYDCFLGLEMGDQANQELVVNNAIFGATKEHPFIQKCMDFYLKHFDGRDSALDSSPYLVTRLLKEAGFFKYGRQNVDGVELFPKEYFYPYHITEKFHPDCVKENTYCIHHWGYSWGKRPFSYRLEHLKKVTKEKLYKILPPAQKAYLKDGKLIGDLLKGGNVKAGPFKDIILPLTQDYNKEALPLKLSGLYKEELQGLIYQLTNRAYKNIYYKGSAKEFFGRGIQKLFPKTKVETLVKAAKNKDLIISLGLGDLLITNSNLAKEIINQPTQLSTKSDYILEFNFHLSKEQKEDLKAKWEQYFEIYFYGSSLNYTYEQNAFLQNYPLKTIEKYLKKAVTDVHEWMVLITKHEN